MKNKIKKDPFAYIATLAFFLTVGLAAFTLAQLFMPGNKITGDLAVKGQSISSVHVEYAEGAPLNSSNASNHSMKYTEYISANNKITISFSEKVDSAYKYTATASLRIKDRAKGANNIISESIIDLMENEKNVYAGALNPVTVSGTNEQFYNCVFEFEDFILNPHDYIEAFDTFLKSYKGAGKDIHADIIGASFAADIFVELTCEISAGGHKYANKPKQTITIPLSHELYAVSKSDASRLDSNKTAPQEMDFNIILKRLPFLVAGYIIISAASHASKNRRRTSDITLITQPADISGKRIAFVPAFKDIEKMAARYQQEIYCYRGSGEETYSVIADNTVYQYCLETGYGSGEQDLSATIIQIQD